MRAYVAALFVDADVVALSRLFAADAVLRFPYAPPGIPSVVHGPSQIGNYYKDMPKTFRFQSQFDVQVEALHDPSSVVALFKPDGLVLATNKPYRQTYVGTLRAAQGRIAELQIFWNPLVAIEALDGIQQMRSPSTSRRRTLPLEKSLRSFQ